MKKKLNFFQLFQQKCSTIEGGCANARAKRNSSCSEKGEYATEGINDQQAHIPT